MGLVGISVANLSLVPLSSVRPPHFSLRMCAALMWSGQDAAKNVLIGSVLISSLEKRSLLICWQHTTHLPLHTVGPRHPSSARSPEARRTA